MAMHIGTPISRALSAEARPSGWRSWDETNRVLLVATADAVFAMRGLVGVSITRGLGGIVRTRGGTLYVLDPARRVLVRITGLDRL